jgi:SAM-dependent methyltransferase
LLGERLGPRGALVAVDSDPTAVATARQLTDTLDVPVEIVFADGANTGLPSGAADVVTCRNVLVHNGRRTGELLAHAATLLRAGGCLLSAEPDVGGIDFGDAHAEHAYEQRWVAMMRADGNDPNLGRGDRLSRLLCEHGWQILDSVTWTDALVIDKSPAWAAADAIVRRAFATSAELAAWQHALEQRRASGPLHCSLTMTAVVATPEPHNDRRPDRRPDTPASAS